MNRKRVWRYYCDFCGRGGCAARHIAKHERGCTANPNRICGICEAAGDVVQQPMSELVAILMEKIPVDEQMKKLRGATENCPACILAAIRQAGLQGWHEDENGVDPGPQYNFDFKKELAAYWAEINAARYEQEMRSGW